MDWWRMFSGWVTLLCCLLWGLLWREQMGTREQPEEASDFCSFLFWLLWERLCQCLFGNAHGCANASHLWTYTPPLGSDGRTNKHVCTCRRFLWNTSRILKRGNCTVTRCQSEAALLPPVLRRGSTQTWLWQPTQLVKHTRTENSSCQSKTRPDKRAGNVAFLQRWAELLWNMSPKRGPGPNEHSLMSEEAVEQEHVKKKTAVGLGGAAGEGVCVMCAKEMCY